MRALAGLAVAVVVFSGCLGAGDSPQSLGAPPVQVPMVPAVPGVFSFRGCDEAGAVYPLPIEEARALSGPFEPVAFDPAGLLGLVFANTYACDAAPGEDPEAPSEEVREELVGVLVQPPDAPYAGEGFGFHIVATELLSASEDMVAVYRAWGFAPIPAGISMMGVDTPLARTSEATITPEDGSPAVTVRSVVAGPAKAGTAGSARIFALNGTEVAAIMDIAWDGGSTMDTGHSVAIVPEGGPLPGLYPGIAFHAWGDDYHWTATKVPLPVEEPSSGSSTGLGLPRGLTFPADLLPRLR